MVDAWYNENDPFAADWLENLIAEGLIAPGVVDRRDIRDVRPADLIGYTQCHFFAGIGGWSYALRLAGWPDDRPVWTGSCPCQPFSAAGRGGGTADERHLWPHWFWLISQCRPGTIFGEQVASKDALAWLDLVSADLEGAGYSGWVDDICAAGVGAPHIRQRLWWVADASGERRQQVSRGAFNHEGSDGWWSKEDHISSGDGEDGGVGELGDAARDSQRQLRLTGQGYEPQESVGGSGFPRGSLGDDSGHATGCRSDCGLSAHCCEGSCCARPNECDGNACCLLGEPDGEGRQSRISAGATLGQRSSVESAGRISDLGDTDDARSQGWGVGRDCSDKLSVGSSGLARGVEHAASEQVGLSRRARESRGTFWSDIEWVPCRDGKWRTTKSGIQPLAHGVPNRVGTLRGAGNAIVAPLAAEFIAAYLEQETASPSDRLIADLL